MVGGGATPPYLLTTMRILFLCHAFNSLTQRLFVELRALGHEVSVEFDINDAVAISAVEQYQPDLIVAPFLKRAIPESIWNRFTCLVIHPGIVGDRGPSSLDWAITTGESEWGVTVLQANEVMDGGPVWGHSEFSMRDATKASLYRNEVTEAAVDALLQALTHIEAGDYTPFAPDLDSEEVRGGWRDPLHQSERSIDWSRDDSATVLRKLRAADGFPGVVDSIAGRQLYLYDGQAAVGLHGEPGALLARSGPAICRATTDGAVWIGHLRDKSAAHPFKLPATTILEAESAELPEIASETGYRDIWYRQEGEVGYLHFEFYNGAMSSGQCERLRQAFLIATQQSTRVIVLMGGHDYWSNGMHLNLIEAASSAADESWRNINAIDDLAQAIIECDSHLTISAIQGNAGAGGVFLARAADLVWARDGVILNPHYKDMGNLYGSEYWSYLLPRYCGSECAEQISQARLPMGVEEAHQLGLVDEVLPGGRGPFEQSLQGMAGVLALGQRFTHTLEQKRIRRALDEAVRPLADYREEELKRMQRNFYGFDPSYHVARYNFVYKVPKSRTPTTIALHRRVNHNRRIAS